METSIFQKKQTSSTQHILSYHVLKTKHLVFKT